MKKHNTTSWYSDVLAFRCQSCVAKFICTAAVQTQSRSNAATRGLCVCSCAVCWCSFPSISKRTVGCILCKGYSLDAGVSGEACRTHVERFQRQQHRNWAVPVVSWDCECCAVTTGVVQKITSRTSSPETQTVSRHPSPHPPNSPQNNCVCRPLTY